MICKRINQPIGADIQWWYKQYYFGKICLSSYYFFILDFKVYLQLKWLLPKIFKSILEIIKISLEFT